MDRGEPEEEGGREGGRWSAWSLKSQPGLVRPERRTCVYFAAMSRSERVEKGEGDVVEVSKRGGKGRGMCLWVSFGWS